MQIGPGLLVVEHLTALTSLDMSGTNVSDAELAAVSKLRHLRSLFASKTKISSRGKGLSAIFIRFSSAHPENQRGLCTQGCLKHSCFCLCLSKPILPALVKVARVFEFQVEKFISMSDSLGSTALPDCNLLCTSSCCT